MKLVLFTKILRREGLEEHVAIGHDISVDGFDLCVRKDYPVNPQNAPKELPAWAEAMRAAGTEIAMVTGEWDLSTPDPDWVEPLLGAVRDAGVPIFKIGYFRPDRKAPYLQEVRRARAALERWAALGERYEVRIVKHIHSGLAVAVNAAALMHLLDGLDPKRVGAYIDAGHLAVEGEAFPTAAYMTGEYLMVVGLKDYLLTREETGGHGKLVRTAVRAGKGVVDWTSVFDTLREIKFAGPLAMHIEFLDDSMDRIAELKREAAFYRGLLG